MQSPKKLRNFTIALLGFLLGTLPRLQAGDDHSHADLDTPGHTQHGNDQKAEDHHEHATKTPGPNGGRIIHLSASQFEFFVETDRKVRITLLDEAHKPIQPTTQVVTAVAGDRRNPTQLSFLIEEGVFLSSQPLPEGERVPIILTLQETPQSQIERERLMVDVTDCPSCDYPEYACVCAH